MDWTNENDPTVWASRITAAWFVEVDAPVDPAVANRAWIEWIGALSRCPNRPGPKLPTAERIRRYLLQAGSGLSRHTVLNYLAEVPGQISEDRVVRLQRIDQSLGFVPSKSGAKLTASRARRRTALRIALVTEFRSLPNPLYHQEVIRSILENAQHRNASLVIHEITRSKLLEDIKHLVRVHGYDGLVLIRLTPELGALKFLADEEMPTITVHADLMEFPSPPILGNIYPAQGEIGRLLRAQSSDILRGITNPMVVLVHMPMENTPDSIRDQRIRLLVDALESPDLGFRVIREQVEDYDFRHAIDIFERNRNADLFVALSGPLALGIAHLVQATSPKGDGDCWKRKVISFDYSLATHREGIISFNQHLDRIGPEVFRLFDGFFFRTSGGGSPWPEFSARGIPVTLG